MANTGARGGDEVVMVFHAAGDDVRTQAKHPVPLRALVDFGRVSVPAGGKAALPFSVTTDQVSLIDEKGAPRLYQGTHTIVFSRGHGAETKITVTL